MKFTNSKKGQLVLTVTLLGIAVMLGYFLVQHTQQTEFFRKGYEKVDYLGNLPLSVVRTYQEGDKLLFYTDQAAKLSVERAVEDVALSVSNPGDEQSGCGQYQGYPIWQSFNQTTGQVIDCFPQQEHTLNTFLYLVKSNLNNYLRYYEQEVPLYNYDLTVKTTDEGIEILGIAEQKVEFELTTEQLQKKVTPKPTIEEPLPGELVSIHGKVAKCTGACMLKKEAAEQLEEAQKMAENVGLQLYVYSSYRSPQYQKRLWDQYGHNRTRACGPGENGSFSHCPHTTGGAVDVRFLNAPMTSSRKQKLQDIMCRAGWVRYANEWWHFEYGTTRYARGKKMNVCAIV